MTEKGRIGIVRDDSGIKVDVFINGADFAHDEDGILTQLIVDAEVVFSGAKAVYGGMFFIYFINMPNF